MGKATSKKHSLLKSNLKITHPEIAKMAYGWNPAEFTYGSKKKMSWECGVGHIWSAQIRAVVLHSECRFCSNRQVLIGFNDLPDELFLFKDDISIFDAYKISLTIDRKKIQDTYRSIYTLDRTVSTLKECLK
jgi:hypothetical protein